MARVFVDLTAAPLPSEIRKRYDLVASVADDMLHNGDLDPSEIVLDEAHLARSIECYFLLSEAYKVDKLKHRPEAPRLTEPSKKAAFTAISLMTFRPLRLIDPLRPVVHELSFVANQALAVNCAGSFMRREFENLTWEMQRRLFRWLDGVGVSCLSEYISDQSRGVLKQAYWIDLDPDTPAIDVSILIFESPLR